jgi:hypothetical protein
MEVDLSLIVVGMPESSAPAEFPRYNDIPSDSMQREERSENLLQQSHQVDIKNATTNKDQRKLATQIRQCFEEFPEKLSTLKNTKLEGKSIEEQCYLHLLHWYCKLMNPIEYDAFCLLDHKTLRNY